MIQQPRKNYLNPKLRRMGFYETLCISMPYRWSISSEDLYITMGGSIPSTIKLKDLIK